MKPEPGEIIIVGKWLFERGKMVADANCQRIANLIQSYFVKVISSPDGWFTIYQDPEDSRYWELSYPQGELQGGGPPMLYSVDAASVNEQEYDPFKKLSKPELIIIVQKLLDTEGSFDDEQAQLRALRANFINWTDVLKDIYETQLELNTAALTAEEIVYKGLARKPVELPEEMPRSEE